MAYTIAFFGTKPYDESSFNDKNKEFGFEIRYYKGHLNKNNVLLTQGVDAVCIFVNDVADAEVIRVMAANGVKLLIYFIMFQISLHLQIWLNRILRFYKKRLTFISIVGYNKVLT